jgi:integrase
VPEAALRRLCDRLGLPAMTPHGLRHLHASLLIDEGVPITAVSARLGHANPQITMRLYAHALPGQDRMAAEAIDRALIEAREVGLPRTQSRDEV